MLLLLCPEVIQGAACPCAPLSLHVCTDACSLAFTLSSICPLLSLQDFTLLLYAECMSACAGLLQCRTLTSALTP